MPAPSTEPVTDALQETWEATARVCGALHPEAWDLPTDCPGWSVRDHVSHLIGTELGLLGERPPARPEPMPAYVHNPIGEMNEAWIEARRGVPASEVLAEFVEVTARRLEQLRALGPEQWDAIGWSPVGDVPYRVFMHIRVFDSWVHGQDIRLAAGRPGDRGGRGEQIALDRIGLAMGFVVGRKVAPPDGTTVLFDVGRPLSRALALHLSGRRAVVVDPASVEPTVRLHLPTEHYVRLACGREDAPAALEDPAVAVEGDLALGRAVLDAMNIMI